MGTRRKMVSREEEKGKVFGDRGKIKWVQEWKITGFGKGVL